MICSDGDFLNVVRIILSIYKIVQILVPLFIIISITRDIYPSIIKGEKDALRKNADSAIKRIIAGLIIIFIPTIIRITLSFIGGSNLSGCISNANVRGVQAAYEEAADKAVAEAKSEETLASYKRAKQAVNKIKDEETRKQYEADLDEIYASIKSEVNANTYTPVMTTKPKLNVSPGLKRKNYAGLNYLEVMPPEPTEGMPLIVFLHGMGELNNIEWLENVNIVTHSVKDNKIPYILIAPVAISDWYGIEQNVKSIIDHTVQEYKVDKEHIILTGFSLGGTGTWRLSSTYGNFFSAVVPVSGCAASNFNLEAYKNVSVKAIYGKHEGFGCMSIKVNALKAAGVKAETEISEKFYIHKEIQDIYLSDDIYEWMISQ